MSSFLSLSLTFYLQSTLPFPENRSTRSSLIKGSACTKYIRRRRYKRSNATETNYFENTWEINKEIEVELGLVVQYSEENIKRFPRRKDLVVQMGIVSRGEVR